MPEENEDIIEITDENGKSFKVELMDIITLDDIEYAILSPVEKSEDEEDDDGYVIMHLKKDGEDFIFEAIEDDDEFEKVAAYIDELADEIQD